MIDIDYFKTINGTIQCKSKKEYQEKQIAHKYDVSYDNTLSTYQILKNTKRIDKAILIKSNGERKEIPCIVDYKKVKDFLYNAVIRELWTDLNVVSLGDIIEYTDRNDGETDTYLIISNPESKREYALCVMQILNGNFNVISDNKISSIPCVISDKVILSLQEKTALTLPNNTYMLLVQDTKAARRIEEHYRFMIDDEVYRVIGRDKHSMKGVIKIKVETDVFNPNTDNKELGIADYKKNGDIPLIVVPTDPTLTPILTINSKSNRIYKGREMTFDLKMSDDSEVPLGDYVWSIDNDCVSIKYQDNKSAILLAGNKDGKSKLSVKSKDFNEEKEIEVFTRML